jgi:hypothetical protein
MKCVFPVLIGRGTLRELDLSLYHVRLSREELDHSALLRDLGLVEGTICRLQSLSIQSLQFNSFELLEGILLWSQGNL